MLVPVEADSDYAHLHLNFQGYGGDRAGGDSEAASEWLEAMKVHGLVDTAAEGAESAVAVV